MNGENLTPVMEMKRDLEKVGPYVPYVNQIRRLIDRAEEMDKVRAEIYRILFVLRTKERMEAIRKINEKWEGINRAREIVEKSKSGEEAIARLTDYRLLEEIENDCKDPILAEMIRNIKIDPRELQLLTRLKRVLEYKDRARAIVALSRPELFGKFDNRLKSFGDERLANDLLDSLAYIQRIKREGSEKIEFMKRFLITMRYGVRANGTPFTHTDYINAIEGFMADLRSKRYDEGKLTDEIEETNIIKHFIYYRSTIKYLEKLLGMIYKGMNQNNWGDFKIFYKGLGKEESVLHKLGDDITAGKLEDIKREFHQFPPKWQEEVNKILEDKNTPGAFEAVRKGAIRSLFKILGERASELNSEMTKRVDAALKELDRQVSKRMKGIEHGKKIAMNIIELREKNLWKELEVTKKGLEEKQKGIYLTAMGFKKIRGVFEGQDINNIIMRIQALIKSKKQWSKYAFQNLRRLQSSANAYNFLLLTSAYSAVHQLERAEDMLVESERMGMNIMLKMPFILREVGLIVTDFMQRIQEIIGFLKSEGFTIRLEVGERNRTKIRNEKGVMTNA